MHPHVKVVLVTGDPKMIEALTVSFVDRPEVQIIDGALTEQAVDAWVSPTGPDGRMDSGLARTIKSTLGDSIERAVQKAIHARHRGAMPAGHATCVETARPQPRFVISTPSSGAGLGVALAAGAALQVVHMQNKIEEGSIGSVALPGFTADGVPAEICADLMWTAYDLFRQAELPSFGTMCSAFEELLRGVDASDGIGAFKKSFVSPQAGNSKTSTIPDSTAAAAQLRRRFAETRSDEK